jgi:AraC-like DNA-binding protein
MTHITIKELYREILKNTNTDVHQFLQENLNKDIGHFNVFNIENLYQKSTSKPEMPYNIRTYYKVSLIKGSNTVEYANKTVQINEFGVLFASPKIPYRYTPNTTEQSGHFCVFTKDFLPFNKTGLDLDTLHVFSNQSDFVFQISEDQFQQFEVIFEKMQLEISSDYEFKYDLLRNYLIELIHNGQKLHPLPFSLNSKTAASRITSLFIELLERQFPIANSLQVLQNKSPKDYANQLNVHVNHLNKVLKEGIGKTTSEIISSRINQEAKILLKESNWNISEIANALGFDEVAHFSNFFKKHNQQAPNNFREK